VQGGGVKAHMPRQARLDAAASCARGRNPRGKIVEKRITVNAMNTPKLRLCVKAVALLSLFLALSSVSYGWEDDVHYGLTFWLAVKAGFKPQDAEMIAASNLAMDQGTYNPATWATLHVLLLDDPGAARAIQKNHFPSYGPVPGGPKQREVTPGGDAA
jgi:hypothetical protein